MSQAIDENFKPTELNINSQNVTKDGHTRIPAKMGRAYDVGEGDIVDVWVFHPNLREPLPIADVKLDQHRRIRIPKESRDRYGIEHGDEVDLYVIVMNHRKGGE